MSSELLSDVALVVPSGECLRGDGRRADPIVSNFSAVTAYLPVLNPAAWEKFAEKCSFADTTPKTITFVLHFCRRHYKSSFSWLREMPLWVK